MRGYQPSDPSTANVALNDLVAGGAPSLSRPMEWQDEGMVLSARPHGETDAIL